MLKAFTIVSANGNSYWHQAGVAFQNKDGSINVILHSLPVNGKLQIREDKEKEDNK